ncbi:ABC transporter ATP-binding protein [Halobacteria archaeon AArc-dxtr1]|nr:ABC transporter ATP-binding protein [Halobacteria archaeon AArc-dxtr1]
MALLEVEGLSVSFPAAEGPVRAVDDFSYSIERGETVGIVGESGAGKSVAARALLDLVECPGQIEGGEIRLDGENLLERSERDLRDVRGNRIGMVFQEPAAAFNPSYTVGEQIAEGIRHHLAYDETAARDRTISLLRRVGIAEAETRFEQYPHQFSGGMLQRAMIAMALACDPELLVCDEPTTGLDVTVQAQILDLLAEIAAESNTAVQLITHDVSVVAQLCERVVVMYAGTAVETAPVEDLFYNPKHPYTVGLLSSTPRLGDATDRLRTIPGTMPAPADLPTGCRFHPRCPYAEPACTEREPPLLDPETGAEAPPGARRAAACLEYAGELDDGLDYTVRVREPAAETGRNPPTRREEGDDD